MEAQRFYAFMGFDRRQLMTAPGRVKSVDLDLPMSGEETGAAVGLARSYAMTRLVAARRGRPKRTLVDLDQRPIPVVR